MFTGESGRSHIGVGMAVFDLEDEAAIVLLAAIEQLPIAIDTEDAACRSVVTEAVG
jgi:hypothetical protein